MEAVIWRRLVLELSIQELKVTCIVVAVILVRSRQSGHITEVEPEGACHSECSVEHTAVLCCARGARPGKAPAPAPSPALAASVGVRGGVGTVFT